MDEATAPRARIRGVHVGRSNHEPVFIIYRYETGMGGFFDLFWSGMVYGMGKWYMSRLISPCRLRKQSGRSLMLRLMAKNLVNL